MQFRHHAPGHMSLTLKDWENINDCLVRLYRELDQARHTRVMLEVLNHLVPSVSIVLNYYTPPAGLAAITLPENLVTEEQTALIGKYTRQSPFAYFLTTEDASWKMTTDFMPIEDFQKLELHRLALGPLGVNYQMGGMLASMDNTAHIITLQRTDSGFTERERTILNTLHPHLAGSHINALAFSRSKESILGLKAVMETAPGAYGYFNADGSVAWVQPKAQAWLLEFFPDEARNQGNIPPCILQLLKQSEAGAGTPAHLEQGSKKELLTAMLSSSPLGGWVLRLERKSKRPPTHFRALPQLTRRKNQVLKWMMEGKRNAEIAKILNLSPRTVEKHVQEILAELKVENRATAIVRAMELCTTANANEIPKASGG